MNSNYAALLGIVIMFSLFFAVKDATSMAIQEQQTPDNYTYLVDMREAAAIEYHTRKQFYQGLAPDSGGKPKARQDVLDAFREWEVWATKVRSHPNYPTH